MSRQRYALDVTAPDGTEFVFIVDGDEAHLADWLAAGLSVDRVVNTVPAWWVDAGFPVEDWCGMQDRGEVE